mgnify:FL=1|jgi:peptidoglycan hydrolase CwlO-like protein
MNLAEEALTKLATHEAQCEERLKRLDEKIDDTRNDIDEVRKDVKSVNNTVLAIYPFILGAIVVSQWLK